MNFTPNEKEQRIMDELEERIRCSVENSLSGVHGPFAILLSGGIDSSLLAAFSRPDIAITCRFLEPKYDEFSDSLKTAEHLGLIQRPVEVTKALFMENIRDAVNAHRPTTHFSLVPLYLAFKKAKELGFTTVLSGEGPDEYLGGYASYSFITHEQELYKQEELANYGPALNKYLGTPMERFARVLGKRPDELKPYWDKYDNLLSKMGYTDLHLRGIEEMELALAKHFGITLLYPYMSEDVSEFCFRAVPDDMKIRWFCTKWILRRIAEKYIPPEVAWRKNKMGGPVAPVGLWLGQENEYDKAEYLALQNELWTGAQ